jgi:hypothetical protein
MNFQAKFVWCGTKKGKSLFLFKNVFQDDAFYRDHVWMQAKHITNNQKKKLKAIGENSLISFKAKPVRYKHSGTYKKAFRSMIEIKEI